MEGVANGDMAMQTYTCSNCTLINPISNEKCSACESIRPQNNNNNNNVHMSSRLSLPSPSISVNIKNEEQPLAPFAPYQENKNQDKFPQPKKQRKCKCLLPIPDCDCDCECDCRNCLCLSECTKFSYPWSTFLGVVVTALYLTAWLTPWLIGPKLAQVPCYSIGTFGELCDPEPMFESIPPYYYLGVCCPPNIGCCAFNPNNASIEMFGESHIHDTDASIILFLTIPVWILSVISHHFTIWSCSSRKNISCWWCCCCCQNNACNVDCCQISETTFTCCDMIQFLTILIRLTTILLTFSTLIMFETNDSIMQLKNYHTAITGQALQVRQPGMIVASIALCFDFFAGLLLSVDFWGRKKLGNCFFFPYGCCCEKKH